MTTPLFGQRGQETSAEITRVQKKRKKKNRLWRALMDDVIFHQGRLCAGMPSRRMDACLLTVFFEKICFVTALFQGW